MAAPCQIAVMIAHTFGGNAAERLPGSSSKYK